MFGDHWVKTSYRVSSGVRGNLKLTLGKLCLRDFPLSFFETSTGEASAAVTAGELRYSPADDGGKSAAADPPPDRSRVDVMGRERSGDKAGPEL